MKINDIIELETEQMSFGPAVVARYAAPGTGSAVVVFVEKAAPGERIRAKLVKKHKNYWEAELTEILRPSKDRIVPPCPVFGECGGCQWQHLDYSAQIRSKKDILLHQLARTARLEVKELEPKIKLHPAKSPFGYRARLQARGDKSGLGFYAPSSHRIVHVDKCMVAHPMIQNAWSEFQAKRPLAELAKATGQFKIEWTKTASGQVVEAINREHAALGFTQINEEQNLVLVQTVHSLASNGGQCLLDLYGGQGNLSRNLVSRYKHVLCVDSFNEGSDPAGMKGTLDAGFSLIRASTEDFLRDQYWLDWEVGSIDTVIADPPRNGLREAARRILDLHAPRLILVSCDPSTLARDLAAFITPGLYRIDEIHLIDMFPQTFHMEIVIGCSST